MTATGLTTSADQGADLEMQLDGALVDGTSLHLDVTARGTLAGARGPLVRAAAPQAAPAPTLASLRAAIANKQVRSCRSPAQPCPPAVTGEPALESTNPAYVFDAPAGILRPALSVRLVGGPTVVVEV